nr:MAG TPA: hypothetical protein [Caudoviricetes sp.]
MVLVSKPGLHGNGEILHRLQKICVKFPGMPV